MKNYLILISISFVMLTSSFKPVVNTWTEIDSKTAAVELQQVQKGFSELINYAVNIKYVTYDSKNNNQLHDQSSGYIVKCGNWSKSRLLGIYTIQNQKIRIVIDSAKQVVQVANVIKTDDPGFSTKDYIRILKACKKIKKSTMSNVVAYRFETKNVEGVTAQEIYLQNGITKEINVFYANKNTYRDNNEVKTETVYPQLQVLFSGFSKLKSRESDFNTDNIVLVTKDKKLHLAPSFKGFKLVDGRVIK